MSKILDCENLDKQQITLSIVSHDQIDLVEALISSIEKEFYGNISIILTLNTSDEHFSSIKYSGLDIQIIHNKTPLGFGNNHNNAMARCLTEHFIVCNPDIDFTSLDFNHLTKIINSSGKGLYSIKILDSLGNTEDHIRHDPTLWNMAQRVIFKRKKKIDHGRVWLAGMFLIFGHGLHKDYSFDDRYFMYVEDADLSRQIRTNHPVLSFEELSVIHHAQRDSRKKIKYFLYHIKSLLKYWWKWGIF